MEISSSMIIKFVMIAVVFYIVGAVMDRLSKQKYERDLKVLRPPFVAFWVGLMDVLVIIGFIWSLFESATEDGPWAFLIIGPLFISLGIWLMLYALNWRIEIKDESFTCTSVFGKKREYKYTEITKFKRANAGDYKLYVGKRRVEVPFIINGYEKLGDKIKDHL